MPKGFYVRKKGCNAGENNPMFGRKGKNNPNFGRQCTVDAKVKISKSNSGKVRTIEQRKNVSNGTKIAMQREDVKIHLKASMNHSNEHNPMFGRHSTNNPNFGRKHTQEALDKMSVARCNNLQKVKSWGNCFVREDLGHLCRSIFEANFCRILKYLGIKYEYEKYRFKLKEGYRYVPDLYLSELDLFVELKGYYDNRKYELFVQQYKLDFLLIKQNGQEWRFMSSIFCSLIKEWEYYKNEHVFQ